MVIFCPLLPLKMVVLLPGVYTLVEVARLKFPPTITLTFCVLLKTAPFSIVKSLSTTRGAAGKSGGLLVEVPVLSYPIICRFWAGLADVMLRFQKGAVELT